jgi:hypothetical protein
LTSSYEAKVTIYNCRILAWRFRSEIDSALLATVSGSPPRAAPAIVTNSARNLLTNLLRHCLADVGTCQVEPHWAQVLVYACGCLGNRTR